MTQIFRVRVNLITCIFYLMSIFAINIITIFPTNAQPIETTTTILSDTGVVQPGDTIHFTIWTYMGYDPVPTGPIRITDTNTSEYLDNTILGGIAIVNWTISDPFMSGIHIFEVTYQGFQEYQSSKGECAIKYDDFESGSSRLTSITLTSNSTLVYKNQSINFTIELTIHSKWYFQGGYINIRNKDLNGSPVIHTYGPLPNYYPGTDPAIMTYSFDYKIPLFSLVGINKFVAEYTGSSESQTLPCMSQVHNITIMSTGYSLVQSVNKTEIFRCEDTLEICTTILGDYPIGLELISYYSNGSYKISFNNQTLTSRTTVTYFSPDTTIAIGSLFIITELVDSSSEIQYTNSTLDIIIMDNIRIDHTENATEFKQEEVIHFELYVTEDDVWTNPVQCQVELIDVTDGNQSIENKTTNQNGYVAFDYQIPTDATAGDHGFCFITHDENPYLVDIEEFFTIKIKGSTEISINYDISGVLRNHNTTIVVTVYSGGVDINEGFISLEFADNQTVIETKSCRTGQIFEYYIIKSHPIGPFKYQIHFLGSDTYDEQITQFILTVYSQPHFSDLTQNASELIIGQTIRISGRLIDETGLPICDEIISLFDVTRGEFLGNLTTDYMGIFFYDYFISTQIELGLHVVEIRYDGNLVLYFLPAVNTPTRYFYIYPPLKVTVEEKIYANSLITISLDGGSYKNVDLYWKRDSDAEYLSIGNITLDVYGKGIYIWTTNYYGGNFSLKAISFNITVIIPLEMYLIPCININGPLTWNVNDSYLFSINSTEIYEIWIDSHLLGKCEDYYERNSADYLLFPRNREDDWYFSFQSKGNKTIRIISKGNYISFSEYLFNITIYEDIIITLSAPLEAERGMTVIIDGTVFGEASGPIFDLDAILIIDEEEYSVDSTNIAGGYYFSIVFNQIGYYNLSVKTLLDSDNFYNNSQSESKLIFIKRDSNDKPPTVLGVNINQIDYNSSMILCFIEVTVQDDYGIDNVVVYIDGSLLSLNNYNGNFFVFGEVWLKKGSHEITIEAFDDTGQMYSFSKVLEVTIDSKTGSNNNNLDVLFSNSFFELIFAFGLFASLIMLGKLINKKQGL